MTKFEEEVKRPVIGIGQSSIKPALGKAVEFYTDKVKEYHNAFSDMNKYIDVIENSLEKKDEQIQSLVKMVDKLNGQNVDLKGELEEVRDLQCEANNQAAKEYIDRCEAESKLKSQLEQQALPVVPDFIGKLINTFGAPEDGEYINYAASYPENQKELEWIDNHQKTWLTALLVGFTVEKPQLFYLKNKIELEDVSSDLIGYLNLFLTNGGYLTNDINRAKKFTQQEIDSMETGSYEKIEVEK